MSFPTLITTYHCTASPACTFSATAYDPWLTHELTSHPLTHNLWACHANASLPASASHPACSLSFRTKTAFETHFFAYHAKDEVDNWRPLIYSEFHIGPDGPRGDDAGRLFWCGFCASVRGCNMTGLWRVDRFEHVAAHFVEGCAGDEGFGMEGWVWMRDGDLERELAEAQDRKAAVAVMVAEAEADKEEPKVVGGIGGLGVILPRVEGEGMASREKVVVAKRRGRPPGATGAGEGSKGAGASNTAKRTRSPT